MKSPYRTPRERTRPPKPRYRIDWRKGWEALPRSKRDDLEVMFYVSATILGIVAYCVVVACLTSLVHPAAGASAALGLPVLAIFLRQVPTLHRVWRAARVRAEDESEDS